MPSAVKLSDELVEAPREESRVWSRSMTQQIEHWARLGRALERSGAVSVARIRSALAGELDFDDLRADERLVALGELEHAVFRPDGDADPASRLLDEGAPVSGVDGAGRLAAFDARGSSPIDDPEGYVASRRRR